MINKKYTCPNPNHEDSTPSANAYADGYHCFGCGARGPLSELGLAPGERIEYTYKEDIPSSVTRIKSLSKQEIRGFQLHADSLGYYILWGDDSYYKRRIYGAESGNKYRGPAGHSKPPFVAQVTDYSDLILIEGEMNAMSLALLEPSATVISPGGAGDFYSSRGSKDLEGYSQNFAGTIHIVVDADAAGAQAAIETKAKLITLGCSEVKIHLVERDFNDILVQDGKEALRDEVRKMGLL